MMSDALAIADAQSEEMRASTGFDERDPSN